jgi:hypothetical protein
LFGLKIYPPQADLYCEKNRFFGKRINASRLGEGIAMVTQAVVAPSRGRMVFLVFSGF